MTVLHVKYRPARLEDVVGQDAAVRALSGLIKRGGSRAFLLSGQSGTGKTTLARIAARLLGCAEEDGAVLEIDAATNTGIDAMRAVQELVLFKPFGKSKMRAVIIDEAHAVSRQAWQSLLKSIEEPPAHVAWFLCTTEPAKIPQTIKTRCSSIALKPVGAPDLRKLLKRVADAEKIKMDSDVVEAVILEAEGSPRQLLVNIALCQEARGRREAMELMRAARESDSVAELGKFLLGGGSWPRAIALLNEFGEESPESVRIGVCNYLGGALRRARSDREACAVLAVIEPFAEPFPPGTERAALALAVGRALYSGGGGEE